MIEADRQVFSALTDVQRQGATRVVMDTVARMPEDTTQRPQVGEHAPCPPEGTYDWHLDLHDAVVLCPDQQTAVRIQGWWDKAAKAEEAQAELAAVRGEVANLRTMLGELATVMQRVPLDDRDEQP